MADSRRPVFILSGALILLILAISCDSGNLQTDTAPAQGTGTLLPTTTINITRSQYEQALEKWHAQGVEEYEARIEYWAYSSLMGIWTLHVRAIGDNAEVLDYRREPGLEPPVMGFGSPAMMPTAEPGLGDLKKELRILTIEAQFQIISEALDGKFGVYSDKDIAFDPQLGSPTYVGFDQKYASEAWNWSLMTIKIVKQATPIPGSHS